ncbi:protein of unknown function [Xenorhabdus poinarii G6]|uniref:Uncharacterized protein n=1 Tax=Xenorhabdus poinarii G6 TaxID=1354304 RepID=A0A068R2C4_9GAMM|nr:protein of unknown function [Xenorhabdus poinarii G6]
MLIIFKNIVSQRLFSENVYLSYSQPLWEIYFGKLNLAESEYRCHSRQLS